MRQGSFRAKCIYVAVMLRRVIDAFLNKDTMDDKVISLISKTNQTFLVFKMISVFIRQFLFLWCMYESLFEMFNRFQ